MRQGDYQDGSNHPGYGQSIQHPSQYPYQQQPQQVSGGNMYGYGYMPPASNGYGGMHPMQQQGPPQGYSNQQHHQQHHQQQQVPPGYPQPPMEHHHHHQQPYYPPQVQGTPYYSNNNGSAAASHFPLNGAFDVKIFKSRYQRNNKRGGLKNLRCFPSCGFRHKERGFCGRSVEVELNHPQGMLVGTQLHCWVEFVKKDDPDRFKIGEIISMSKCEALERGKDDPIKPWIRGERLDEKSTDAISCFEFNKERRGWHYGWASNKHTCNAEHCLQCYVFETTIENPDLLVCRTIFRSPYFMLFCRRRRRFTLAPSAPTAVPLKRARELAAAAAASGEDIEPSIKRERQGTFEEEDEDDDDEEEDDEDSKQQQQSTPKSGKKKIKIEPIPPPPMMNNSSMNGVNPLAAAAAAAAAAASTSTSTSTGGTSETNTSSTTPPNRRRIYASGDSNRMEVVMRRLAVIFQRIQQQHDQKMKAERKEDEINSSLLDALELFSGIPDTFVGDESFNFENVFSNEEFAPISDFGNSAGASHSNASASHPPHPSSSSATGPVIKDKTSSSGTAKTLKRSMSEQMMDDIALYLSRESAFARAVENLQRQSFGGAPNYAGFLKIVQEHLDAYRRSRNISRAEFDRVFSKATNTLEMKEEKPPQKTSFFGNIVGGITSAFSGGGSSSSSSSNTNSLQHHQQQPLYLDGLNGLQVPNLQGSWKQSEESEQAMQEMRYKLGTPWILSKMFEFMESRFDIELNSQTLEMITRLNRRWLSNTTLRFKLDGDLHHWGISLPPPFSQLSQGWTYRAWVEDNKIILSHMIGDQRVTRINWINRDRSILHSILIFEIQDSPTSPYREMGRVSQQATAEFS